MSDLVIESQYFPCIATIQQWQQSSSLLIEQWETYQKMSFRNRCIIVGSNGLIHLSIPLEKGRQQRCPMKEVKIDTRENWQQQHWRTIFSCYGSAPFFEYYQDALQGLYRQQFVYLIDLNMFIMQWLKKVFKIQAGLQLTEQYLPQYPTGFSDIRNKTLPKNFQQTTSVHYTQVFEEKTGFQTNLSILDLLLCAGPQAL